jgi:hypothetical protein
MPKVFSEAVARLVVWANIGMLVKVQADKNANTPFARLGLKIEAMWDMSFLSRLNKLNLLNLNHSTMAFICPRSFCHKAHELNGPLRSFLLGIDIKRSGLNSVR